MTYEQHQIKLLQNLFFLKPDNHIATHCFSNSCTQVDNLTRPCDMKQVLNVKVIVDEECTTQDQVFCQINLKIQIKKHHQKDDSGSYQKRRVSSKVQKGCLGKY